MDMKVWADLHGDMGDDRDTPKVTYEAFLSVRMTIAGVETDLGEPIILTQAMTDLDGLVCEVEASIKNQLITKEHIAGLAEEANDILDGYKYAARDGE